MAGGRLNFRYRWPVIFKILLLIALIVAVNLWARDLVQTLSFPIRAGNEDMVHRTIMMSAALYAGLLAIPFVPGAEIGIGLMVMLGPQISLLVYVCTLVGLSISFVVGRLIPLSVLIRFFRELGLERSATLLETIEPLDKRERIQFLVNKAPKRIVPWLLRYRYLALAVALNIPGNYLIGGGGGIALFAGVSRLFSAPGFFVTILLAVAPVPFAVMFFGTAFLT